MTQKEVVAKIAAEHKITQEKAEAILKSFFLITKTVVKNGGEIQFRNFGKFHLFKKGESMGWNPGENRMVVRPPKDFAKFKASSKFLD